MDTFGYVLITVVIVAGIVSALSFVGSGKIYRGLGREGGLSLDEPDSRPRAPVTPAAAQAEAQEEIRQMLEAKNARREAKGQAPLDIDAEMASLMRPTTAAPRDAALEEEVRSLVIARNERRARQGKPPLDVEAEIDRQLRELGA